MLKLSLRISVRKARILDVALEDVNGAKKYGIKMKDYTINTYCDFLWINNLLELKKTSNSGSSFECWQNGKKINVCNVIIFGTIVEVKQIGCKGYLYRVDDGTGVISCKHSEHQFEKLISVIESEQFELLNRTSQYGESTRNDFSADDSIFNDKSIQCDESNINERNKLLGLQSIWDDIYKSFNNLIDQYTVGDSVVIYGKLYTYFNTNQIYVNSIRRMELAEEIVKVAIKLDEKFDTLKETVSPKSEFKRQRLSGLMTFDNIQHLNPNFPNPRTIKEPEIKCIEEESTVFTPNLKSTITFDTFLS